jgi:subtilase family serine protease
VAQAGIPCYAPFQLQRAYDLNALYRKGLAGRGRTIVIVDVTIGDNTVTFTQHGQTFTVQGFPAVQGYDLSTGWGTVDAAKFVPELARGH